MKKAQVKPVMKMLDNKYFGNLNLVVIHHMDTGAFTQPFKMADSAEWLQHFKDMADGKIQPDARGIWIVREVTTTTPPHLQLHPAKPEAKFTIVSNTQQHVEQAKASQKRKKRQSTPSVKKSKQPKHANSRAWIQF